MIEIRRESFSDFFDAPFNAYGDRAHVSLFKADLKRFLDPELNPLFSKFGKRTYFTAHRDGKAIGRLTAHIHAASNDRHGWKRCYFGFFDCAEDEQAARGLLEAAGQWGREQGCDELIGNFNLTAMQMIGVVTGGFERVPYSDQVYNPPHIPRYLEANGFEPTFPMRSFEVDLARTPVDELLKDKHQALLSDPEFRWEPFRKKTLDTQLRSTRELLNDGFDQNPMFVPLTWEEFEFQAKDLSLILDERISIMAWHRGKPVGVLVCIPDLSGLLRDTRARFGPALPWHFLKHRVNRKRAVVIFQSVSRDYHSRGVGAVLVERMMRALIAAGYEKLGITWVWDENIASLRNVERIGGQELHRLHLFRKQLQ